MKSTSIKSWRIVRLATWTGDERETLYEYSNRGHAIARLKGLNKAAWLASSEIRYGLRRG